jgi:uncharacterized protein YegP (UPF0339 family)
MTIYRGYEVYQNADGTFSWKDETGTEHGGFKKEDDALNAIDAHRRELRQKASA